MSYQVAIDTYIKTLADFAFAHNLPIPALHGTTATDLITRAQKLALPPRDGSMPDALSSIMGSLLQNGKEINRFFYNPQEVPAPLGIEMGSVVQPVETLSGDVGARRSDLWRRFMKEYESLLQKSQSTLVMESNLHALMQRFCWSLPAPVAGADDVSLFDYARVSGALAVCLQKADSEASELALLVGADLSGVQEFLYTLSSDGAAKSLRGRSVYLQLLMEVMALDLLHHLELPAANLLYVGGGNFYLLAKPSQREQIAARRKLISQRLLSMHEGALYLAVTSQPIRTADLMKATVGATWGRVADVLNEQKAQRFAELDDEQMAHAIGSPLEGTGINTKTCRVCQRAMRADEDGKPVTKGDINVDERKCDLCSSFDELGFRLSRASYLGLVRVNASADQYSSNTTPVVHWSAGLERFGYRVYFERSAGELRQSLVNTPDVDIAYGYYWMRPPDRGDWMDSLIWAYRPLAQCVPLNEIESLETFNDLARNSEGIERWGVLRMDVDRLGDIFQEGMNPNTSLSRVVSLSGLMRLFFEGYLPQIAQSFNQSTPQVHLMYAGGDDLFIVGSWSVLPELARKIRNEFAQFACYNPKVTISGGISIAPSVKYPLYQSAEDAHEAERQSKNYGRKPNGKSKKNALTLLDQTMTWETGAPGEPLYDSFDWVSNRVDELKKLTSGDASTLPRSFLMTLRSIDAEWRDWILHEKGLKKNASQRYKHDDQKLFLGPWLWNLVYSLHRAAERTKNPAVQAEVKKLVDHIVRGEITTIGLSTRWIEYLTRKEK